MITIIIIYMPDASVLGFMVSVHMKYDLLCVRASIMPSKLTLIYGTVYQGGNISWGNSSQQLVAQFVWISVFIEVLTTICYFWKGVHAHIFVGVTGITIS